MARHSHAYALRRESLSLSRNHGARSENTGSSLEKILAGRGAIARAAKAQGRD
jgi:hypothetical protein